MMHRDKFPMQSEEAEKLAAGSEQGEDWNNMSTTTQGRAPKDSAAAADHLDAAEGLTTNRRQKNHLGADDDDDDEQDDYLDRPVGYKQSWLRSSLSSIYERLYGKQLPPSEMLRTLCLASTLFFMIGGYWLLRSLKDPVLTALCGVSVIPRAKMLSVPVVLFVVSVYNRLLDSSIPKHQLFYVFGSFYFCLFTAIALLLKHPVYGLPNEQASPSRILGWISYCSIESFGSVMVSLYWSFANSTIDLKTAKASYGVMVATAQVGSILGPTVVNQYAQTWGVAHVYLVGSMCMVLLQFAMYNYISIYGPPASAEEKEEAAAAAIAAKEGSSEKKKSSGKPKAGVLEGLRLFWDHNYVKGIFAISCLFMVEVTIVDYTMKVLAHDFFSKEYPCEMGMSCWETGGSGDHGMSQDATAAFTRFMGLFGQATNTLSFLLSLLGTSAVIRYLGLRLTLLLFPSLCLAVIILVRINPTLYVVFAAMMILKACSYALNNPTKEMLYQPTSPAVKYKAKSWIDIFGARGSKALGSVVTNAFSDSTTVLVQNGSLVGMCVASFLIWNATYMGRTFDEYQATGHVVGLDDNKEKEHLELAVNQNNEEDTSCAVQDDEDAELGPQDQGQEPQVTRV